MQIDPRFKSFFRSGWFEMVIARRNFVSPFLPGQLEIWPLSSEYPWMCPFARRNFYARSPTLRQRRWKVGLAIVFRFLVGRSVRVNHQTYTANASDPRVIFALHFIIIINCIISITFLGLLFPGASYSQPITGRVQLNPNKTEAAVAAHCII